MEWFRFYNRMTQDEKVRTLRDWEFRFLVHLWCVASQASKRGFVYATETRAADPLQLAMGAGCTEWTDGNGNHGVMDRDHAIMALNTFEELGLIERDENGIIHIINWEQLQYDKPSDHPEKVNERVRRYRDKKRGCNADVTPLKRECNAQETPMKRQCNAGESESDPETEEGLSGDLDYFKGQKDSSADSRGGVGGKNPPPDSAPGLMGLVDKFQQEYGRPLSPGEREQIRQFLAEHPPDVIGEALRRAVLKGVLNMRYIDRILQDWRRRNLRTLRDVLDYERLHDEVKNRGHPEPKRRRRTGKYDDLYRT